MMTVASEANETVQLLADEVFLILNLSSEYVVKMIKWKSLFPLSLWKQRLRVDSTE